VILLLNGPNLSQLGHRDVAVYGSATIQEIVATARAAHPDLDVLTAESEGELVERLHRARTDGTTAVIVNPGALGHYSYALRDALEILAVPKVEVHLSQTHARQPFRRHSVIGDVVDVSITGAGALGYQLAVQAALHLLAGDGQDVG
jgi:3-dehydroquinate dehydratase-2